MKGAPGASRIAASAVRKLKIAPAAAKQKKKHLGHAVANLAGNLLNPKKVAKSVKKAVTGKGIVLPGSNYIGPGNEMKGQKTKSRGDVLAKRHDQAYDNMLKKGAKKTDVYLGYSRADKKALKGAWKEAKSGSGQALAVAAGMGAKALLHKSGLTKKFSKGARQYE